MNINLSSRQAATVATALTIVAAVIILLGCFAVFYLLTRFVNIFASVFLPLFLALITALVLRPIFDFFSEELKVPPIASVTLIFISILLPTGGLIALIAAFMVEQSTKFIEQLPELAQTVDSTISNWPQLQELLVSYGFYNSIQELASQYSGTIRSAVPYLLSSAVSAGSSAFRAITTGFSWIVIPVYFYFFLIAPPISGKYFENFLPFLKDETRKDVLYLVDEFIRILVSFFRGQLLIALLQGLLFAVAFHAIGLNFGFIIGLTLGFLNLVPYLGSMLGLAVVIPLSLLQVGGGIDLLALTLTVFAIIQLLEGYLLTPKIMGNRTGLHPLSILVGLLFWSTAFDGFFGMVLAIPLTAFLVVFWRLAKTKYIQEIV